MNINIDDAQRAELLAAVMDRKAAIAKHVKSLTADAMPEEAELAERRLNLYSTDGNRVGLVAMFALQPDLDEERVKRGEVRDADGQQDIFGGGAATGGGHPAGERGFPDVNGTLHPTEEDRDAVNAAQAELNGDPDDAGQPLDEEREPGTPFRALSPGDPVEAEFEIVDDDPACVLCGRTKAEHYGDALVCQPGGGDVYTAPVSTVDVDREHPTDADARTWTGPQRVE